MDNCFFKTIKSSSFPSIHFFSFPFSRKSSRAIGEPWYRCYSDGNSLRNVERKGGEGGGYTLNASNYQLSNAFQGWISSLLLTSYVLFN